MIRTSREERQSPAEWLRRVLSDAEQMHTLLLESGGLGRAAYRLARAQCRVCHGSGCEPSLPELRLAARMIAHRTGRRPEVGIDSERAYAARERRRRVAPPPPPSRRKAS